jgi:hypothetical protein
MSNYSEFFLKSSSKVVQLELLEISHPSWSKVYRVVRNAVNGVTVQLEDYSTQTFEYYPTKIDFEGDKDDLDQKYNILFGDLGEILPLELDRMLAANTINIKPKIVYRLYRSDRLSSPMTSPVRLEVQDFTFNQDGCNIHATAPSLNLLQTGEEYTTDRFPTLLSYL